MSNDPTPEEYQSLIGRMAQELQEEEAALSEGSEDVLPGVKALIGEADELLKQALNLIRSKTSCTNCGKQCFNLCYIGSRVVCVDCFGAACEKRKGKTNA